MKKILHLSFLFLATVTNTGFATSCPPANLINEKIKNFHSTINHEGLKYHINHSDFTSKSYHFSQTVFSGAEVASLHKAPNDHIISCHYKTFDKKNGEIVLESNVITPKNIKPEGAWVLEEGVHSCDAKKDKTLGTCSFTLVEHNPIISKAE